MAAASSSLNTWGHHHAWLGLARTSFKFTKDNLWFKKEKRKKEAILSNTCYHHD
jgi:hypothetical protein